MKKSLGLIGYSLWLTGMIAISGCQKQLTAESRNTIEPLSIMASETYLEFQEDSQITVDFKVLGTQSAQPSVSAVIGDTPVALKLSKEQITISVANISKDFRSTLILTVNDGQDRMTETSIPVHIHNTSADNTIAHLKSLESGIPVIQGEAIEVISAYETMLERMGRGGITNIQKQFKEASQVLTIRTRNRLMHAKEAVRAYVEDGASESVIEKSMGDLHEVLGAYANLIGKMANIISKISDGKIHPVGSLYVIQYNQAPPSIFVGNPRLGAWQGNTWYFNAKYHVIEDALDDFALAKKDKAGKDTERT